MADCCGLNTNKAQHEMSLLACLYEGKGSEYGGFHVFYTISIPCLTKTPKDNGMPSNSVGEN